MCLDAGECRCPRTVAGGVAASCRVVASVANVGNDAIVVGQLHLICRHDAEQLAVGGMSYTAEPRPRREHVIESPIGIHCDRRKRVAVGPGMSAVPSPATSHTS